MPVKTNVNIGTLGYVILYVKDTAAAVPFYRDTLGLTLKVDDQGWVEFETGAATLALHSIKEGKVSAAENMPTPVFTVEKFEETVKELKSAGIKFVTEPKEVCEAGPDKTGMSAELRDPDGNMISLFGWVAK
ncbi:MAG TPA: VOC family protein [Drouetiella sp.]